MGFLGFGKKKDFVDLGEKWRKQKARADEMKSEMVPVADSASNAFGFLGGLANASDSSSERSSDYVDVSSGNSDAEEKKRRLTKRLVAITEKLEDLSNQIYHLQQRIELIERKAGVR